MSEHTQTHRSDPITEGLDVYQVGGSVRDELLGLPVTDKDYVVVGSDPETMKARGFQSVGQDFPVFLHPKTHDEYALARLERKQGHGYHGFEFETGETVTLEQDLSRRDLTINAMAIDSEGQLIDPYHGRLDLAQGILRHVSDAFREDPVRVLRLARFATRFHSFSVADSTVALCHQMQASGELSYLVPERVWQEMAKALMYPQPSRFVSVLIELGALSSIWPQLDASRHTPAFDQALRALDLAGEDADVSLEVRFALLCLALSSEAIASSCDHFRVPNQPRYWAKWASDRLVALPGLAQRQPKEILTFIQSFDGLRQPERLAQVQALAHAYFGTTQDHASDALDLIDRDIVLIEQSIQAIQQIDTKPWVLEGLSGQEMATVMDKARLACIEQCQSAR